MPASGFRPSSAVALKSGGVGAVTALQVRDPGALEQEQDPLRPVVIVTVGITGDADAGALQQSSTATGGTSWIAQDPRDIANIFVEALSARKPRL
ncbi:hypothetical protein ACNHUS_04030 [Actinomycetes bacterium M1A6_2h]